MPTKLSYQEKAEQLAQIIDIAIDSIKLFPPRNYTQATINQFITVYLELKEHALNPESRFKNLKSLSYAWNDALIYFQEGSGKAVGYFWEQIAIQNIDCKRENKMVKILKRKRINNQIEYDFVTDAMVPYQQQGLINDEEFAWLSQLIGAYENKQK